MNKSSKVARTVVVVAVTVLLLVVAKTVVVVAATVVLLVVADYSCDSIIAGCSKDSSVCSCDSSIIAGCSSDSSGCSCIIAGCSSDTSRDVCRVEKESWLF